MKDKRARRAREREMDMSRQINDLTGRKFGRLTVLELLPERKNGQLIWLCRCECGKTTAVRKRSLIQGSTRSCGCLVREAARARRAKNNSGKAVEKKAASTPYPANEDCASYDPERNRCRALNELLCATRGTCSFFLPGETP